jgi:hypothetical protein
MISESDSKPDELPVSASDELEDSESDPRNPNVFDARRGEERFLVLMTGLARVFNA